MTTDTTALATLTTAEKVALATSALKGRHNVEVITSKAESPFNKGRGANKLNECLGIIAENIVKTSRWNCFAGSDYKWSDLWELQPETSGAYVPHENKQGSFAPGAEGIIVVSPDGSKFYLRLYALKGSKHETSYTLDGEPLDIRDSKFDPWRKPARGDEHTISVFGVNVDNIKHLAVDGAVIW